MEYEKNEAKYMRKKMSGRTDKKGRKYTAPRENTDEGPTT